MPNGSSGQAARINYTPYITQWSEERDLHSPLIERPGRGIGYLDETLADRDEHGVLWFRTPSRPGNGEPLFAKVHPLRQRRARRRLLCNVCAKPADRTDDGVLWLLRDFRDDWPGWPECMGAIEPPVCLPCVRPSSRMCPALRKGAVAVRVRHAPIAGVRGALYRGGLGLVPEAVDEVTVAYEDPAGAVGAGQQLGKEAARLHDRRGARTMPKLNRDLIRTWLEDHNWYEELGRQELQRVAAVNRGQGTRGAAGRVAVLGVPAVGGPVADLGCRTGATQESGCRPVR